MQKTVLEAVNAMLGGGLRVGVLHHGKKITLSGIQPHTEDNIGFSLEPNCTRHSSQLAAPEDIEFLETVETTEPLARYGVML